MNIHEKIENLVNEFSTFDDWMDKYNLLIEKGKEIPAIEESYKTPSFLIKGCQSQVWLHASLGDDGNIHFTADSDALITKGIAAILLEVVNNEPPKAVAALDFSFVDRIGLKEHLSPTRSNGLLSMIKQIHLFAKAFEIKQQQS